MTDFDPDLKEILFATPAEFPIEHDIHTPARSSNGLVLFLSGSTDYYYGTQRIPAEAGSLVLLPQGRSYRIERKTPTRLYYLNFLTVEDRSDGMNSYAPFSLPLKNSTEVSALFDQICTQYVRQLPGCRNMMKGLFYQLLAAVERQTFTAAPRAGSDAFLESLQYLEKHFMENGLRIEMLAEIAGCSTRYYDRLFQERFRESPKAFLLRLRIEYAKSRLAAVRRPLAEIAEECGFSDAYHFSKSFKARTGESPSEYRRRMRV